MRGGRQLFDEVELPLVRVLAKMEDAGIGVDRGYLEELGRACGIASRRWRSRCIRPPANPSISIRHSSFARCSSNASDFPC